MNAVPGPALRKLAAVFAAGCVSLTGLPGATAAPVAAVAPRAVVQSVAGSAEMDGFEAEVLRLTNKARSHSRKCGGKKMKKVRRLSWSPTLAATADQHSADMATNDYFSHYTPSGVSPFQRMRSAGYRYRAAGENIAAGRSLADPAAVVNAWLKSPGHCRVIMNGRYKELGVGRVEGPGKWGVYWTQNFGARK
jgi:uncharacterized protein YkwD